MQTDEPLENIRVAEKHVRFLWRWILMPLLFCLIGTIINFQQLPSSTIVKAVGLIFAGAGPIALCLLCEPACWCSVRTIYHNTYEDAEVQQPAPLLCSGSTVSPDMPRCRRVHNSAEVTGSLCHPMQGSACA